MQIMCSVGFTMHDLVIRNARLVDGTGSVPRVGVDVAVDGDRITAVESSGTVGRGRQEIDAEERLLTPGWVDIHSHFDGQASWDPLLSPSSWHGVTTTVMGNCGVGFAPAAPDRHEWLIELMEGVEDIPGSALAAGIDWEWETFPQYLDSLAARNYAIDVGTHVPHGAVRAYVMGERGARNAEPTDDDISAMAKIVTEGVAAGALGFSTSRTMLHRALDGEPVPGTYAGANELLALGRAMAEGGRGVFEVASDIGLGGMEGRCRDDVSWMAQLSIETRSPVTYALVQSDQAPDQWRDLLDVTSAASARGGQVVAMVAGRPGGLLLGLDTSLHPFKMHPTYRSLEHLPPAHRVIEMSRPEVRSAILAEQSGFTGRFNHDIVHAFHKMYPLGTVPDYEPSFENCFAERARHDRRDPYELTYDYLLERDGQALIFFPTDGLQPGHPRPNLGTSATPCDGVVVGRCRRPLPAHL